MRGGAVLHTPRAGGLAVSFRLLFLLATLFLLTGFFRLVLVVIVVSKGSSYLYLKVI